VTNPARPDPPAHAADRGRHRAGGARRVPAVRLGVAAVAVVAGTVALLSPAPMDDGAAGAAPTTTEPRGIALADTAEAADVAEPLRVRVPAIDVDSPLVDLGVDADGALVPPEDFSRAGWLADGTPPGAVGPAVIAGHVDSYEGPAVFFRLGELTAGDEILVDRADGSTARFEVREVGRYPKDAFPTEEVYGPTPRAELRLITCGGTFDRDARSYEDNVVVTAVAT
jgi:sortase (surface protein transpeptidase)